MSEDRFWGAGSLLVMYSQLKPEVGDSVTFFAALTKVEFSENVAYQGTFYSWSCSQSRTTINMSHSVIQFTIVWGVSGRSMDRNNGKIDGLVLEQRHSDS